MSFEGPPLFRLPIPKTGLLRQIDIRSGISMPNSRNYVKSVELNRNSGKHTSNVASAAELKKGGRFKSGNKAGAVDWLME